MRPAHNKEQRQKELRRIEKEQRLLWEVKWNLPLIKLDKPIRHGWYKEIVLTKNLERYKSQKAVEEIFAILNTYFWGRTKKECDKRWDCERSKHFIHKEVPTIGKKQFNKLSRKAQILCTPFQYRENKKLKVRFYVRIPHNAYRVKYTRAYNTHRKLLDPNLESRLTVLEERLLSPGMYEAERARNPWNWRCSWQTPDTKRSRIKSKQELREYRYAPAKNTIEELSLRELNKSEARFR